jgi:hypothetical protein
VRRLEKGVSALGRLFAAIGLPLEQLRAAMKTPAALDVPSSDLISCGSAVSAVAAGLAVLQPALLQMAGGLAVPGAALFANDDLVVLVNGLRTQCASLEAAGAAVRPGLDALAILGSEHIVSRAADDLPLLSSPVVAQPWDGRPWYSLESLGVVRRIANASEGFLQYPVQHSESVLAFISAYAANFLTASASLTACRSDSSCSPSILLRGLASLAPLRRRLSDALLAMTSQLSAVA